MGNPKPMVSENISIGYLMAVVEVTILVVIKENP